MDIERALIAKVVNGQLIEQVVARGIGPQHFADESNRAVYQTITQHMIRYGAPPSRDVVLMSHPNYRLDVCSDTIEFVLDKFVEMVQNREAEKSIIDLAQRLRDPHETMSPDLLFMEYTERVARVVPNSRVARLSEAPTRIELWKQMRAKGRIPGIPLGIPSLDGIILGVQPHELCVISAPSSWGKSTLMQWICLSSYLDGPEHRPVFISLEMEADALLRKFDTMATNFEYEALRALKLGVGDLQKWEEWGERVSNAPNDIIIIDDIDECVTGDTVVHTRDGIRCARDLGGAVDVLSRDGVYRTSVWRSYGVRNVCEVTFDNGETARATEGHQWIVKKETNGGAASYERVSTTALEGRRVPIQGIADFDYEDIADYYIGVRHGLIWGDGTIYRHQRVQPRAQITQYGDENCEVLTRFFSNARPNKNKANESQPCMRASGMPAWMKELPDPFGISPEYARGFVAGAIASDGSCDTKGGVGVYQANREALDHLRLIAAAAGIPTHSITTHRQKNPWTGEPAPLHRLGMSRSAFYRSDGSVDTKLILKQSHRQNMLDNADRQLYATHVKVLSVRMLEQQEEVFCCEEPETQSWVAGFGYLTGNCTVERVFAETLRWKPSAMFVDYFGIMTPRQMGDKQYAGMAEMAKAMKRIPRRTKIPLFTAAQTNRSGFRDGVKAENVADTIEIFRSADIMLGLEWDEEDNPGEMTVKIVKSRDSKKGSAQLDWDLDYMQIREKPRFAPVERMQTPQFVPKNAPVLSIIDNPFFQQEIGAVPRPDLKAVA